MTTNTDVAMPELPESTAFMFCAPGGWLKRLGWRPRNKLWQSLYTADQMREYARAAIQQAAGAVPESLAQLLTDAEAKSLLELAEAVWGDLQKNQLGGYSGINRPFYLVWMFKTVIERYGHRDVGLTRSKDALDEAYERGRNDTLAASPSPPKQQPVHLGGGEGGGVPLTDAQYHKLYISLQADPRSRHFFPADWFAGGVAMAEAAHGIGNAPRPESPTGEINKPAGQGMEGGV